MKVGDLVKHPPSGAMGLVTYVFERDVVEVELVVLGDYDYDLRPGDREIIFKDKLELVNESG